MTTWTRKDVDASRAATSSRNKREIHSELPPWRLATELHASLRGFWNQHRSAPVHDTPHGKTRLHIPTYFLIVFLDTVLTTDTCLIRVCLGFVAKYEGHDAQSMYYHGL